MKKIIVILLCFLMLIGMSACAKKEDPGTIVDPVVNPNKEVNSPEEFSKIGIYDIKVENEDFSDLKYYIVNDQIAQVNFKHSNHDYCYRASKDLGVGTIAGIMSTPTMSYNETYDNIGFNFTAYPEGLLAVWIKDMVTYSLFGRDLEQDNSYEFARVVQIITGIEVIEDEKIALPEINAKTTKDYIELWFEDNGFKDVQYLYESSNEVEKNCVIKLSKSGEVSPLDEIIVTVSTGPEAPKVVKVPGNMLNYTVKEFEAACEKLGMKTQKLTSTYYSTTIKKGNVFSYPDGDFPVGYTIEYSLSRGAYSFDADDYNGLTKDEVQKFVKTLNNLNAHVNLTLKEKETDDHPAGKVYKCSGEKDGINTNVTCKLAVKSPTKLVELPNYVGTYNNPCGVNLTCTLNQINYMIDYVDDEDNPSGLITAQTVPAGKVEPGTNVKLVIASNMPYLYKPDDYNKYEGSNYKETEEALMQDSALGKFANLTFETVSDFSARNGQLLEIWIFDEDIQQWRSDYQPKQYSRYTRIKAIINNPVVY